MDSTGPADRYCYDHLIRASTLGKEACLLHPKQNREEAVLLHHTASCCIGHILQSARFLLTHYQTGGEQGWRTQAEHINLLSPFADCVFLIFQNVEPQFPHL